METLQELICELENSSTCNELKKNQLKLYQYIQSNKLLKNEYETRLKKFDLAISDKKVKKAINKYYSNIKNIFGDKIVPDLEGEKAEDFVYISFSYALYNNASVHNALMSDSVLNLYQHLWVYSLTLIDTLGNHDLIYAQNPLFKILEAEIKPYVDFHIFQLLTAKIPTKNLSLDFHECLAKVACIGVANKLIEFIKYNALNKDINKKYRAKKYNLIDAKDLKDFLIEGERLNLSHGEYALLEKLQEKLRYKIKDFEKLGLKSHKTFVNRINEKIKDKLYIKQNIVIHENEDYVLSPLIKRKF